MSLCKECKDSEVWFKDAIYCKQCSINLWNLDHKQLFRIDRYSKFLVKEIADYTGKDEPQEYTKILMQLREFVIDQLKEHENESEQVIS